MIGLQTSPKPAYITVGLDEIEVMTRNLVFALQHTRFVKIKVDGDVEKGMFFLLWWISSFSCLLGAPSRFFLSA